MKNKLLFLLVLITFIFSGCISKRSILSTNYEIENIKIQSKLNGIELSDTRDDVTEKEIHLPTISFPGQKDKVSPMLTDKQKQMINQQIQSYFSNEGENMFVKCEIIKGYKEFTAHALHETAYVQIDVKISLLDTNNKIITFCTSSTSFEVKSLDATYNNINDIYEKALRTSIYKCFEKLKV